jgi:uncharacterized pyridoxamine 5'-phosphate oxidase family protein
VKFLDDLKLKARLLEERPFLKAIGVGKPDDPLLAVFKIHTGEAHREHLCSLESLPPGGRFQAGSISSMLMIIWGLYLL